MHYKILIVHTFRSAQASYGFQRDRIRKHTRNSLVWLEPILSSTQEIHQVWKCNKDKKNGLRSIHTKKKQTKSENSLLLFYK